MEGKKDEGAGLFSVVLWQHKRQWAQIKTWNHIWTQENLSYCEGGQTQEQVARRGSGVSDLGGTQYPSRHSPGQLSVGDSAWAGDLKSSHSPSSILWFCGPNVESEYKYNSLGGGKGEDGKSSCKKMF